MISFSVGASIVMLILNLFAFFCLFWHIGFLRRWRWLVALLLIGVTALEAYWFNSFRRTSDEVWMLQLVGAMVGTTFVLFFVSLVYFLLRIPLYTIKFDEARRRSLKAILDVTILIAAVSYILYGLVVANGRVLRRTVNIPIKGLAKPLSIVQITDVHIGKVLDGEFMQEVVDAANALDGDIVVITGDLIDLNPSSSMARRALQPLRNLKSRHGVYFVLGNHEYFQGPAEAAQLVRSLGITVLTNQNVQTGGINLCGVNDLRGKRTKGFEPDLPRSLDGRDPRLPTVLLSHQPKIIRDIIPSHAIDLVISGHTHGGQIFPFGLLVLIDQPYLYGLYRHDERTQVYVSSGAGYWGPPMRVGAPSEVVKLQLQPED
jgi:predicted MPP superfamily phosphohydrolase